MYKRTYSNEAPYQREQRTTKAKEWLHNHPDYLKEWRKAHSEKIREYVARYRDKHKAETLARWRRDTATYKERNPERRRQQDRNSKARRRALLKAEKEAR